VDDNATAMQSAASKIGELGVFMAIWRVLVVGCQFQEFGLDAMLEV
jgi:hypothetical protein